MSGRLVLISALIAAAGIPSAAVAADTPAPGTDTYLVAFDPGVNPVRQALEFAGDGAEVVRIFHRSISGGVFELTAAEAADVASDPDVRAIEPDRPVYATSTQTGAGWNLDRIDQRALPLNSSFSFPDSAGTGVKVYVLDTGVRSSHREFAGRLLPGTSMVLGSPGTEDCNGHGTHVAALAAGSTFGVAKRASIVPVRVLDCQGQGMMSSVIAAFEWVVAVNNGAPAVVNLSLGSSASAFVDAAVARLTAAGVTVVAAAGNSSVDACQRSPGRAPSAITVAASTSADAAASFTNLGPCVDLFAPGSMILSAGIASDTATATMSGTSMASPHVAGAAALLLAQRPFLSPAQVQALLVDNASPGRVRAPATLYGSTTDRLVFADPVPLPPLPAPVVATSVLPPGVIGETYAVSLEASSGSAPYRWTAAAPPPGLTIDPHGVLSGTPTREGISTFDVRVSDAAGMSGSATLVLEVASVLAADAATFDAQVGVPAQIGLPADGGLAPLSWTLASGSLPSGLTLDPRGVLSGTPTVAGTFTPAFSVRDAAGQTAEATFTITVRPAPPGAFRKASPLSGASVTTRTVRLTWFGSVGSTSYEVCLSPARGCGAGSSGWMRVGSARSLIVVTGAGRLFWQVRAVNISGRVEANSGTWSWFAPPAAQASVSRR